jgi:hypothetical protein
MGLTSANETAEVAQWAKQYPEVAAEIVAIQMGLEGYAQAHAVTPDPAVKEKIFTLINSTKTAPAPVVDISTASRIETPVRSISSRWKNVAAASIILLAGSSILNYSYYSKYQKADTALAAAETALQQQKDVAQAMKADMGVMTNKNATPVSLAGMPDASEAAARIYWIKNTGEVYIDPSNLPEAPKGKQYQFWAIVDGTPVSGGMIDTNIEVDGKKVHLRKMKSFGNAQAFAVSLENAGPEKPVPSKVVVMGKL